MARKRWRASWIVLLLASTLLTLLASPNTRAFASRTVEEQAAETQIFTFEDLGYTKDETFEGVFVTRDYAIHWPNAWDVQPGNELQLEFSHSSALHPNSSMAVDWNGVRLTSVLLQFNNAVHATLKVGIPEDLITPGYNVLHLEFYMGLHEDICEDVDNPASWAAIHKSSFFTFSYTPGVPPLDLSFYPLPLIDNSTLVENQVTFVLPEQPSLAELSALSAISARLGELASLELQYYKAGRGGL